MWFLYLVCLIIALVINYIIAKNFSDIAEMKGHQGSTYFWFTFLFGLAGMLMVIALPNEKPINLKNTPVEPSMSWFTSAPKKDEVVPPSSAHKWLCYSCKKMRTQSPCEYCGKE